MWERNKLTVHNLSVIVGLFFKILTFDSFYFLSVLISQLKFTITFHHFLKFFLPIPIVVICHTRAHCSHAKIWRRIKKKRWNLLWPLDIRLINWWAISKRSAQEKCSNGMNVTSFIFHFSSYGLFFSIHQKTWGDNISRSWCSPIAPKKWWSNLFHDFVVFFCTTIAARCFFFLNLKMQREKIEVAAMYWDFHLNTNEMQTPWIDRFIKSVPLHISSTCCISFCV